MTPEAICDMAWDFMRKAALSKIDVQHERKESGSYRGRELDRPRRRQPVHPGRLGARGQGARPGGNKELAATGRTRDAASMRRGRSGRRDLCDLTAMARGHPIARVRAESSTAITDAIWSLTRLTRACFSACSVLPGLGYMEAALLIAPGCGGPGSRR